MSKNRFLYIVKSSFKWNERKIDLRDLKRVLSKWQVELNGIAWNSLYFCNHDQPRIISRIGNDSPEYREISAKMIATCLHMMQGTPYVYQGEEIGMTNVKYDSIDDYNCCYTKGDYHSMIQKGISPKEALKTLAPKSRDNARTPYQWDDSKNAGFSIDTPWI